MEDVRPGHDSLLSGFVTLVEQLPDCAALVDANGRVVHVNPAFLNWTGFEPEEVRGERYDRLFPDMHDAHLSTAIERCLNEKQTARGFYLNHNRAGESYFAETTVSPLRCAEGEACYVLVLSRNTLDIAYAGPALEVIIRDTPLAMYVMQDGRFRYVNQRFLDQSGLRSDEVTGQPWFSLLHPDDRTLVDEASRALLRGERQAPFEYRSLQRDGQVRWYLGTVSRARFDGRPGIIGTRIDITERKFVEQRLKEANSLYQATIESTADGIVVIEIGEHRVVSFNQQFASMWRLPPTVQAGMTAEEIQPYVLAQVSKPEEFLARSRATIANVESEVVDVIDLRDGRVFEVHSKPQWIEGHVAGRVWSFRDITERRHFESKLLHVASHDALTGLLNRTRFQEEVTAWGRQALPQRRTGLLILLDIDRFKDINDSLGHRAGDEVIVQVGRVIENTMQGHLVGRFGGDEFVVFMGDVRPELARAEGDRVRAAIAERVFWAGGIEVAVTASAGLALYPEGGEAFSQLLSHADLALYEAKGSGRNRSVVYTSRIDSRSQIRLRRTWQNILRDALEHDKFALYAQPIVRLPDGAVTGHELLLRLRRDEKQVINAGEFVAIAEQIGLIREVDRWVIRETAALIRRMRDAGITTGIGINLSGVSFGDDSIVGVLQEEFERQSLSPQDLVIELTETAALNNLDRTVRIIERLRALGCLVTLDDFGAGFSSFHELRALPLDGLKIDGSFIRNIAHSPRDAKIVGSIVELSRALGIMTVAEQVSDRKTLDVISEIGVDRAQGFYIGKPRPAWGLVPGAIQAA